MEGLIKGIVDIAIGHDDRDDQPPNNEAVEERPRSTWAEVVSGENDDGDDRRPQHHSSQTDRRTHNQWNPAEHESYVRRHESEFTETRPSALQSHQNYGEDGQTWKHDYNQRQEESEGGWQTVPKKHPKKIKKVHRDNWDSFKRPAREQEYSNEVEGNSRIEPSDEELSDLSLACSKLWEIDLNRLVPGKDYQIDCGEGKKVYCKDDMAEGSLFTWLEDDVLRRPTISRFFALLDNYNAHEGHKEVVTEEEKQEQAAFIEEISRTAPIKYLYKYLSSKGIISGGYNEFKRLLTDLWFSLCNRGGTYGSSSAFEHVFVGEIKQREEAQVSGFHNWIQFYLEEAKGRVDYQGYILPRKRGEFPDTETQLLTLQFEWNGVLKSVSSSFIGVSPEFEVALYTLCFFAGGEDNFVQLGPYNVNIKCYRLGNKIGSAFPLAD